MTQTAHTPGPWRVFAPFGLERAEIVTDRATADETESIISFDGEDNTLANARLIAAAPKLLELAERALIDYTALCEEHFEASKDRLSPSYEIYTKAHVMRVALKDEIAKAKGGAA